MYAIKCKGRVEGTPVWWDSTHDYSISPGKMQRLNLALPSDTTQWEAFFKEHADIVEEREQNVPVVRLGLGDFTKSAPSARLEDKST